MKMEKSEAKKLIRQIKKVVKLGFYNENISQYHFWLVSRTQPNPFTGVISDVGLSEVSYEYAKSKLEEEIERLKNELKK